MDLLGLASMFSRRGDFQVVAATDSLVECQQHCQSKDSDIVLLDATYPNRELFATAAEMLKRGWVRGILLLDDEVCLLRVKRVISLRNTSYFTKFAGFAEICDALKRLAEGEVSYDTLVRGHLYFGNGKQPLRIRIDKSSIADLTQRELDVLMRVAQGDSVREVAEKLKLSESTVDNHKSKLMKKLCVHKVSQLTRLAIREGLIDCRDT